VFTMRIRQITDRKRELVIQALLDALDLNLRCVQVS
jgi:hypothetical protein